MLRNPTHEKFAQLIATGHIAQAPAWLQAIGSDRAKKTTLKGATAHANKVANYPSTRARIAEIQSQSEQECRWGRKQLLDFYCDCLETGAGQLQPNDRLCQAVERTTVEHHDSKGRVVRTIEKQRLILPSKVECAQGIRSMLGWDRRADALPEDDVTELLLLIRKRSGGPAIPQQAVATEVLTDHLQPRPQLPPGA